MADNFPVCPECNSEYTYELGNLFVCSMCAHEWLPTTEDEYEAEPLALIRDAVGNPLADGDTVIIVKDLRVKGSSAPIKVGTRVRNIRLVDGVGDHDIECKIEGFGPMQLKSGVVKKA